MGVVGKRSGSEWPPARSQKPHPHPIAWHWNCSLVYISRVHNLSILSFYTVATATAGGRSRPQLLFVLYQHGHISCVVTHQNSLQPDAASLRVDATQFALCSQIRAMARHEGCRKAEGESSKHGTQAPIRTESRLPTLRPHGECRSPPSLDTTNGCVRRERTAGHCHCRHR